MTRHKDLEILRLSVEEVYKTKLARIAGTQVLMGMTYANRIENFFRMAFEEALGQQIERLLTTKLSDQLQAKMLSLYSPERKPYGGFAMMSAAAPYGQQYGHQQQAMVKGGQKGKGKKGGDGPRYCFDWLNLPHGSRGMVCSNPSCSFVHSLPPTKEEALQLRGFASRALRSWNVEADYATNTSDSNSTTASSNTPVIAIANVANPASGAGVPPAAPPA
ncbi:unnamed protein product [Amoebophrya sp. A25]|nr:unnamed protein product [Amoebophrya sp. A25]|eukprot:GSA25T00013854001.1